MCRQLLPPLHGLAVDDNRVLPFSHRESDKRKGGHEPPEPPIGEPEEIAAPGNSFAVLPGQRRAISLEFRTKGGNGFAVPYGYRPLLWWQDGTILVEYPGLFSVALRGQGLASLYQRLLDHRVTWIRECGEVEALALPLAVTQIEIIRAYPSREEGV